MKIPDGFVEIEVEISEEGHYKCQVIGHGDNTSCKLEKDDEIINDILEDIGSDEDSGLTDTFYEEEVSPIKKLIVNDVKTGDFKKKREGHTYTGRGVLF